MHTVAVGVVRTLAARGAAPALRESVARTQSQALGGLGGRALVTCGARRTLIMWRYCGAGLHNSDSDSQQRSSLDVARALPKTRARRAEEPRAVGVPQAALLAAEAPLATVR